MKFNPFKLKITSFLVGFLTFFLAVSLSRPGNAVPADIQTFVNRLTPQMERLLQQQLHRRQVFFDISPQQSGTITQLEPYARIDRDTVFEVSIISSGNIPLLTGKVLTAPERDLIEGLASESFPNGAQSHLAIFPYADIDLDYGITVKASSNLYTKPTLEIRDLATQVRMGTAVKLLDYSPDRKFVRVRIEDDGYLAWIQRQDLLECDRPTFEAWINAPKVQLTETISQPQTLYLGTRLPLVPQETSGDKITVSLPDSRPLELPNRQVISPQLISDKTTLIQLAQQFMPQKKYGGGSYLWGGTVGNRLDCSGFVQTVFREGNFYLPRDAYQQQLYSQPVAETLQNLNELQPGDLVFFSENRRLATHVGIYIGNSQFIHSTPRGGYSGVKINRLRNGTEYDRYFQRIYFGGGRVPQIPIGHRTLSLSI
ncbi:C40 family peptidase [Oscillatoria acuminata]|uniref:Cell wall-associated hydrolase, invasion-associated protein n=1 Tax=Oscillatoria acuminata PCC 6304 TaxID=56110 RepID=K9TLU1_9CYAN|nr:C40 family peptidase [Oscillatoria acuminata]AFY82974.1 cell wall-associated hydrolase, invasion-associated protein [Oscillatoria acuminata PCC 6304]